MDKKTIAFIMNALRRASSRWPTKYEAMNDGRLHMENKKTGRMAYHNSCQDCGKYFVMADLRCDHIKAIGPFRGSWDSIIGRQFCHRDGLQRLCVKCHDKKTAIDRKKMKN